MLEFVTLVGISVFWLVIMTWYIHSRNLIINSNRDYIKVWDGMKLIDYDPLGSCPLCGALSGTEHAAVCKAMRVGSFTSKRGGYATDGFKAAPPIKSSAFKVGVPRAGGFRMKRFRVEIVDPTRTRVEERTDTLADAVRVAKNIGQMRGGYSRVWIWDSVAKRSYSSDEWLRYVNEGHES